MTKSDMGQIQWFPTGKVPNEATLWAILLRKRQAFTVSR